MKHEVNSSSFKSDEMYKGSRSKPGGYGARISAKVAKLGGKFGVSSVMAGPHASVSVFGYPMHPSEYTTARL